jgi:hypothetical protein
MGRIRSFAVAAQLVQMMTSRKRCGALPGVVAVVFCRPQFEFQSKADAADRRQVSSRLRHAT